MSAWNGWPTPGTFQEAGLLVGATEYDANGNLTGFKPGAYVMGLAEINGRPVAIGGDDFTISGGSPHDVHKGPRQYTQPLSLTYGIPYVGLIEGVGHSSKSDEHSGRMALPQGDGWWQLAELMRNVPVAAGFMGACAGLPAASGCMSHFNCMVKEQSQVFPSGPPVVERAIGEKIHKDDLGGYKMHVHTSGEVDNAAEDEEDLFDQIRSFLSYLPDNMYGVAERIETGDDPHRPVEELLNIVPPKRTRGYDPRKLIRLVVDNGDFFEMRRYFGGSLITGFGRFDGYSAGIIGNDPMVMAGAMDGPAADKYAHFVMLCDAFNLPIVIFLDMPGFMLGSAAERGAQMRRGARALLASAEAEVPKVEFMVRKSYGVAADAPNSIGHPFNVNLRFGWPAGEWGGIPIGGGRRRRLQARDRGRARSRRAPPDDRGAAAAPALADQGRARLRCRRHDRPAADAAAGLSVREAGAAEAEAAGRSPAQADGLALTALGDPLNGRQRAVG